MADHPSSNSPTNSYSVTDMLAGFSSSFAHTIKQTVKTFHYNAETVFYTEYEGHGHPPYDLGRPGDVYIDVSLRKRLFARASWWQEWTGIVGTTFRVTIKHPLDATRVLWCSPNDISWRKSSGIGTSIKRLRNSSPNFSVFTLPANHLIESHLSNRKETLTASPTERKRKAPDSTSPTHPAYRQWTKSHPSTHPDQNTAISSTTPPHELRLTSHISTVPQSQSRPAIPGLPPIGRTAEGAEVEDEILVSFG